jgi:hypothetical protein
VLWLVLAAPASAAPVTFAELDVPGDGTPQQTLRLPSGRYTIKVSNTISETFPVCDGLGQNCMGDRTVFQDALYCYAHTGYSPPEYPEYCSEIAPGPGRTNWLKFKVGDAAKGTLFDLAGQPPTGYHGDHNYEVTFDADWNGQVITAYGSPGSTDTSSSGSMHIEFILYQRDPEEATGGECATTAGRRAFMAALICADGTPAFGRGVTFAAPDFGDAALGTTPTIPRGTKSILAAAELQNAARGPIGGVVSATPKTSKLDDVIVCFVFAIGGFQQQDIAITERLGLNIFIACSRLVDPDSAPPSQFPITPTGTESAAGCRTRIAVIPRPGKRLSRRALRRRQASAVAAFKPSCAASAAGELTLALTARKRRGDLRRLVGRRLTVGFMRQRAPTGTDGPDARLVVNWDRVRG